MHAYWTPSVTIMSTIFTTDADCARPATTDPYPTSHPLLGVRLDSSLSFNTYTQRNTKLGLLNRMSFKCVLTFPLLWLFPWPQMLFFYTSLLFKIFLNPQGHLQMLPPSRSFPWQISQPSAENIRSSPSKPAPADVHHLTHEHFLPFPATALSFVRMEIPWGGV